MSKQVVVSSLPFCDLCKEKGKEIEAMYDDGRGLLGNRRLSCRARRDL